SYSSCLPLARRVSRLVTRQLPWNVVRLISSARFSRSRRGSGAGANASGPASNSKTKNPRRRFIATRPLRSKGPLQGEGVRVIRLWVEHQGPAPVFQQAVDDLHVSRMASDQPRAGESARVLEIVEVQVAGPGAALDGERQREAGIVTEGECPAVSVD